MITLVLYKDDNTGGAWWPIEFITVASFANNRVYKIYNREYSVDTMVFREAWESAMEQMTWDAITKRPR